MAAFRPLQPAPMDEDTPPQPQARPLLTQKPKRTVTLGACVACRKRKSKCDGSRPVCTCCSQKDTDCIYELGPNEKPSQAMKRKNEEMQGELSNLRQLYDFIRFRPEHEALDVFKRIRQNPTETPATQQIQELADFVRHGDLAVQQRSMPPPPTYQHDHPRSVTLPPLRLALDSPSDLDPHLFALPGIQSMSSNSPASYGSRFSDDYLSARPDNSKPLPSRTSIESLLQPGSAPAAKEVPANSRLGSIVHWTTVTNDSHLLVSIMTEFISREYSYFHYIDKDAFLSDMATRRTNFCSDLLVNALLATASSTCPAVLDRSKPFSEKSIMTAFFLEAKRLWDLQVGQNGIPRLEAAICFYVYLSKNGRDKEGMPYLQEACRIGHNLGFYEEQGQAKVSIPRDVSPEKWSHVCAITAWALFNFQLSMAITYKFRPIITTLPNMPVPYHKTVGSAKALFRSECLRNSVLLDCVRVVQRPDGSARSNEDLPNMRDVDKCYYRLLSWWESRPRSIHPDSAPTEENLLCAMIYETNVIDLFQPIVQQTPLLEAADTYVQHAQRITSASMREIRRLLALQESRHGWTSVIGLILHPISVAGFGSLDEIAQYYANPIDAERSEPYQGLLVCLRALSATCSYIYYAQPLFRLITQKCQALNLRLPIELRHVIETYNSSEWTKAAASLVRSQYIADTRVSASNAECVRMDAIVSAWGNLSIDEQRKGKEREREREREM